MSAYPAIQHHPACIGMPSETFYHPNYVLRIAGEPVDILQFPEAGLTLKALKKKKLVTSILQTSVADTCALIEKLIHGLSDKNLSRDLLSSKRSLFNRKAIKPSALEQLERRMEPEHFNLIAATNDLLLEHANLDREIQRAYELEVESAYGHLQAAWQRHNIRQGVSYSNPKLFWDFEREYGSIREPLLDNKKKKKLDDTLFQYMTRCATKTSPLSALTPVYVGRWASSHSRRMRLEFDAGITNRVEFKSGLLRQIMDRVLENFDLWRDVFPLYLNSSVEQKDGKIHFTQVNKGNTAGGKTWGTGESHAELPLNNVLRFLLAELASGPQTAAQLQAKLCGIIPQLDSTKALDYIGKLYGVGLLMPDLKSLEQGNALDWTENLLCAFGERFEQGLVILRQLREQLADYPHQLQERRAAMTESIEDLSRQLAEAIGSSIDKTMERPAFFENTYITACRADLSPDALESFADDLKSVLELSPILDMNQKVQAQFADYFINRFGPDHVCENPLELIREFDAIYGVAQFGFTPEYDRMAPPSTVYEEYSRIADSWDAFMLPYLSQEEDVNITAQTVRELAAQLPEPIRNRSVSQSYVGQIFDSERQPKFVINQVFGGYSGLLSRFLEILPESQLQAIKEYLSRCSRSGYYAELPGVFGFNANLHPRMADHEVVVPPFAANWPETHKISVCDLTLVYDKATHKVCFAGASGTIIDIWYQGFLIPSLMPQIQRFIAINNANGLNFYTIGTLFNCNLIKSDAITRVPRVSVGNVVISRRMHLVPRHMVPSADLAPFEFFMAIQTWREANQLPNEAFVRTFPIGDGKVAGVSSGIDWNQVSFKDAKPFYVKFDDPRYVRLLARMLKRSGFDLTLTEVLPKLDDQHVTVAGRNHVAELHIELSRAVVV